MSASTLRMSRAAASGCALVLATFVVVFVGDGGSHAADGSCLGRVATIVGTDELDHLVGTAGSDVIMGLGADDVILGRGGNDRVCGGGGSDQLFGGDGKDRLAGQGDPSPSRDLIFPSGDTLAGGHGDDVLYGGGPSKDLRYGDVASFRGAVGGVIVNLATGESHGQGDDRLVGVEGIIGSDHADYLRSVGGFGEVHAGKGNDRLVSATGRERLLGGGGVDHLVLGAGDFGYGNAGDDVLKMKATGHAIAEGDGGDDTFIGGPGPDTFYGFYTGFDQDVARGHGGSDVIALGIGNDLSFGGSGADHIMAGPGEDLVDGGKGRDRYSGGSLSADGFRVDLRLGTATGGGTGVDRLTSIRDLDGSADDDVLIGNRYANDIFAGPGDDHLSGGAGDDVLNGFDDVDRADGGPGTDTCVAELRRRCEG